MSPTITPMIRLLRVTSARPSAPGEYPSSRAATSTRSRVAADTGCRDPLRTRDAVAIETSASRLISASDAIGNPRGGNGAASAPIVWQRLPAGAMFSENVRHWLYPGGTTWP